MVEEIKEDDILSFLNQDNINHIFYTGILYRVVVCCSTLKNDQVSDYIINPIKKCSKCQNFLRVWHLVIFRAEQ